MGGPGGSTSAAQTQPASGGVDLLELDLLGGGGGNNQPSASTTAAPTDLLGAMTNDQSANQN